MAISLQLGELKLLFVGAHFAAHDDQVERRNADYHDIRTGLFSKGALADVTTSPAPSPAPGSGPRGIFRVGSEVQLPSSAMTPKGGMTPTAGWGSPGSPAPRKAWGDDDDGAEDARAAAGSAAAEVLGAGVSPKGFGGFWRHRLGSGGGGSSSPSSGGGSSGLFGTRRSRKVAPEPGGAGVGADGGADGVPGSILMLQPRAASFPGATRSPSMSGGRVECSSGAGELWEGSAAGGPGNREWSPAGAPECSSGGGGVCPPGQVVAGGELLLAVKGSGLSLSGLGERSSGGAGRATAASEAGSVEGQSRSRIPSFLFLGGAGW